MCVPPLYKNHICPNKRNCVKSGRKMNKFRMEVISLFFSCTIWSVTLFWVCAVWLHWRQDQRLRCWYSSHVTAIIIFNYCKRRGQTLHSDSLYTTHKADNGVAKSVRERLSFSTEEQAHPGTLPVQFTETAGQEETKEAYFAINYLDLKRVQGSVIGFSLCLVST